ncbi:MAG: hypothetical protein DF168_01185 [Candidatus Moanabacter tarae]|uniref:Uncharacterized protein n=1 Tax=Candidatus Moanibacter tarae TaxID=2200854 RepID=A0A2Z4AG35_9BACT|nr:MAG: hypothetical protein DF168_01185 [Candidatus Moanabacter tarae]
MDKGKCARSLRIIDLELGAEFLTCLVRFRRRWKILGFILSGRNISGGRQKWSSVVIATGHLIACHASTLWLSSVEFLLTDAVPVPNCFEYEDQFQW